MSWDRFYILDQLADQGGEDNFQSLRFYLGLAPSSLNNHLSKLERAGLIRLEKLFVNNRPMTKAVLTEAGSEAYLDHVARMQEYSGRAQERREKLAAFHRKDRK